MGVHDAADHKQLDDATLARRKGAAGMDGGPAVRPMLRRVPDVVQDLERGDRRRQHLHVAAGRPDDLADRRARGRLHALAARAASRARCRSSTSSPATTRTCSRRASCCARSSCRPRRCRSASPSGAVSLTHLGRSAALLIGTRDPSQRRLPAHDHRRHAAAGAAALRRACRRPTRCAARSTSALPPDGYFDDVHGSPPTSAPHLLLRRTDSRRTRCVRRSKP